MAPECKGLGLWSFAEWWTIFIFPSETLLKLHTNLIQRVLLRQHIQAFIIRGCLQCHCLFDINSSSCAFMYCNCPDLFGHTLSSAVSLCCSALVMLTLNLGCVADEAVLYQKIMGIHGDVRRNAGLPTHPWLCNFIIQPWRICAGTSGQGNGWAQAAALQEIGTSCPQQEQQVTAILKSLYWVLNCSISLPCNLAKCRQILIGIDMFLPQRSPLCQIWKFPFWS